MSAGQLTNRQRGLVYASAFFGITTESLIGMLLPLWALARGLPPAQLGIAVALASLSPLLLAVPAGALCDRTADGAEPAPRQSPAAFRASVLKQYEQWERFIRTSGIKLESDPEKRRTGGPTKGFANLFKKRGA